MDMPTYEELFKQVKISFWAFGIPFNQPKIKLRFYILFILLSFMAIAELAFLLSKTNENLLVLTGLIPCCCIGCLALSKILPVAAKIQKVFYVTECLNVLYVDILNDERKKKIVLNKVKYVPILSKYYFILNMSVGTAYSFLSLVIMCYEYLTTQRIIFELPFPVLVPFSLDSWYTWVPVYCYSVLSAYICCIFFSSIDTLYCTMTLLICNNFEIIADDISNLSANNCYEDLRKIIMKHQYTFKLSQDLEDIFNLPHFFNYVVGSVEICALGFNLTMGDWAEVPACMLFLVSVLLQIFIMSSCGENIIQKSQNVGEAAFNINWYDMDELSKKIILIIIMRSNKEQKITAYKFSVISYKSFMKIISTSWSYFTLLKSAYNIQTSEIENIH